MLTEWGRRGLEGAEDIICSSARSLRLCYLHTQLYGRLISLCSAAPSPWSRSSLSTPVTPPIGAHAEVRGLCRGLAAGLWAAETGTGIRVFKDILCDSSNRKRKETKRCANTRFPCWVWTKWEPEWRWNRCFSEQAQQTPREEKDQSTPLCCL